MCRNQHLLHSPLSSSPLIDSTTTELPDSFDAAVSEAVASTLASTADGWSRLRMDFDTSAGDATYTMLKSSLRMTRECISQIAEPLLAQSRQKDTDLDKTPDTRTIRLYFPDAGSAALCKRDWKVGQAESLVPTCVRFSSITTMSFSLFDFESLLL